MLEPVGYLACQLAGACASFAGQDASSAFEPSIVNAQPVPKCDVMAVPLVASPNGLLTLNWRRARLA